MYTAGDLLHQISLAGGWGNWNSETLKSEAPNLLEHAWNSKQYRISKHSTPKHRKSDLSPSESDRLKSELSMFGAVISKRYGWELHIGVIVSVFSAGLAPLQRGPSMSGAVIYTRYGWELHIRDNSPNKGSMTEWGFYLPPIELPLCARIPPSSSA